MPATPLLSRAPSPLAVLFASVTAMSAACSSGPRPAEPVPALPRAALPAPLPGLPGVPVAVTNVSVIPMDRDTVLPAHTVLVRDGRIVSVAPVNAIALPRGTLLVNGTGRFLVPGLADMHVHLDPRGSAGDRNERTLALFVANGVTTVRNMSGSPAILELAARVRRGEVLGPAIVTTGPAIEGPDDRSGLDPGSDHATVTVAEQARAVVHEQVADGYAMLQVGNTLSADAYGQLLDEAHRVGIPVVGHVPYTVGLQGALAARQASIEHLDGYVTAVLAAGAPIRDSSGWQAAYRRYSFVDTSLIRRMAEETAAAGVWNTPTLVLDARRFASPAEAGRLRTEAVMRYVDSTTLAGWRQWDSLFIRPLWGQLQLGGVPALHRRLVGALRRSGARLLAGTDTPNPYLVAGFSLHDELELLVEAGLTPYQALRAATADAARFLGRTDEFGTVAPGRRADLLLLDADPLADIRNTTRIAGVMVAGRWLAEAERRALLERAAYR